MGCGLCLLSSSQPDGGYSGLQIALGALFGTVLGLGFHFLILVDMELDEVLGLVLAVVTILLLAVGNATSRYVRCICLLILPSVCGRTGRSVLKTFALALVIGGPITNLGENGREVVRVFGCTSQLVYNLTKTKYQILVKPFQEAVLNMRHDEGLLLNTLDTVQDVVDPLVQEIEGEEELEKLRAQTDYIDMLEGDSPRVKEIEKKYRLLKERKREAGNGSISEGELFEMEYKRKLEYRCQGVVNEGSRRCEELFQSGYDKCYEAMSVVVAWLLCWPMKITFMCNLVAVFGGSTLCDPSHVIEPGFGEMYTTVKHAPDLFSRNMGNVKVEYTFKPPATNVNISGVAEVAKSALRDFSATKSWFDTVSLIIRRLFALFFLLLIFKVSKYLDKYLTVLDFDNKYIGQYFRKLDRRQRERGRNWLLPLTTKEKKYLVEGVSLVPDRAAICQLVKLTLLLILEMIPVCILFALDVILYHILDIIAEEAHVEFTQKGSVHMKITIHGGGLIANLLRSLVHELNVHHDVHVIHSNVACLPQAKHVPTYFFYKVFGLYLIVWLLILADSYTGRLKSLICAHFYPKEKENVLLSLRFSPSGWLRFLQLLQWARRGCLVCQAMEPAFMGKRRKSGFVECLKKNCGVYCVSCAFDTGQECHVCGGPLKSQRLNY